jgi:hypothetical protein
LNGIPLIVDCGVPCGTAFCLVLPLDEILFEPVNRTDETVVFRLPQGFQFLNQIFKIPVGELSLPQQTG